ncbi:phosphotransferase family protein [Sandaracinobacter neustonicus]|uniref:phosphotransferase family protein n=1 Tax=Sandaracinobacter neustonicus TaxID=1715348 RepID=UPI0015E30248|nr:phosphotransferase family protein [Sandaracinobacter neustonicus]
MSIEVCTMLDPMRDGKAALQALIERGLAESVTVGDVAQLTGGASSATYRVEIEDGSGPRLLIFQRTAGDMNDSAPRSVQADVQARAGALGVPVARVIAKTLPSDDLGDGVVTELVEGEGLAPRWLRGEGYTAARAALTGQCAEALARLHSAPVSHWADLPLKGGSGAELLADMFGWYRRLGVDVPAFDLAFAWLKPRMPQTPASCLVHGDFRSGNILVGPEGLTAVLDWELTHLSVPAEDLAWLCVQAWRFGQWQLPVGGFGTRAALLEAYGGGVTAGELHIWEVYGNLKWGMSCLQLADDHVSGRVPSVERAAIGRRVSEVAADLTYLLTFGEL